LRPGQNFNARDVVHVDVERALNGRNGLLVQVLTHAGQWTRVIAVVTARNAAHEHTSGPGTEGLVGHAGQELHVIIEIRDVQLLELLAPNDLDAQWNVLQVLLALLRRDDHLLENARWRFLSINR
jgi:hypothetical protein